MGTIYIPTTNRAPFWKMKYSSLKELARILFFGNSFKDPTPNSPVSISALQLPLYKFQISSPSKSTTSSHLFHYLPDGAGFSNTLDTTNGPLQVFKTRPIPQQHSVEHLERNTIHHLRRPIGRHHRHSSWPFHRLDVVSRTPAKLRPRLHYQVILALDGRPLDNRNRPLDEPA